MGLFLPLLLTGCATTPWGTWAFTLAVTAPVGDECATEITHNVTGAHPALVATTTDESWTATADESASSQLFFGRIDEYGQGSMLIVGTEALPGTHNEDGSWTFGWTGEESTDATATHASGYDFSQHTETSQSLRIKGTFNNETFTGSYLPNSQSLSSWGESDTWADEAAVYVGDNGEAPIGAYLFLTDAAGAEVPANNGRAVYDCDTQGCTLTVEATCTYAYEISGQLTEFTADDAGWTEDAGQPAGL
ncbi:MAG: hypothetical protein EXR71_14820 [Myxococcales bacterium]|nr:hypothetical protein [Myxococcales bacterium]